MDDKVVNRLKPLFDGDGALNRWIESVLHKAMEEYAEQYELAVKKKNFGRRPDKETERD